MINESSVKAALQSVKYPGYSRDVVSFGLVKEISITEGAVHVKLQVSNREVAPALKADCQRALQSIPGVGPVFVEILSTETAGSSSSPWAQQSKVAGIKRIIAVASGKGGVGKSTVSANLACALKTLGSEVGLLDCDIYGPSIPLMMGVRQRPTVSPNEKLVPPANFGIKLMSMGFLLDGDTPVIWRGPMIVKTIQQFIHAVEWGNLDYLLVDLPPGTGDAQLTLCQTVPLDGGVIVTTPQEASLGVARKGMAMFQKVNVPILGLIENMSYFTTPQGERIEIFGHGGGAAEAVRQQVPFLGEIPLFEAIRQGGDAGLPVVISAPETEAAKPFFDIARVLQRNVH